MDQNSPSNPNIVPVPEAATGQPEAAPTPSGAEASSAGPAAPPPTAVVPQIPVVSVVPLPGAGGQSDQAMPYNANPVIADDVDVIEKEWVDRAEEIIKTNAQDPHAEEEAVENLQIDYMKKRYNKDIKKAED